VSQRVAIDAATGERRDALDQRWAALLAAAGCVALPVPNLPSAVPALLDACAPAGVLLTGGNDLARYGGDAPERDATELALIDAALARGLGLLGVCRGMQVLQDRFGVPLEPVAGHVRAARRIVAVDGERDVVCYHRLGSRVTVPGVRIDARAEDGVVEALSVGPRVRGLMWHPERRGVPDPLDLKLLEEIFG